MSAYSDKVIADGCSYYWRLGETSGTTAVAAVGGVNGTISGGVTLGAAGALSDGNTAMTFNGTTGLVTIPAVPVGTGSATVECWVKTTVLQAFKYIVDFKNDGNAAVPGMGFLTGGAGQIHFEAAADGAILAQPGAVVPYADGAWHHLVGVVRRAPTNLAELYCDGAFVASGAFVRPGTLTSTAPAGIGAASGVVNPFQGSVDEVAIYPRALTAPEIAAHYTLGKSLPYSGDLTTRYATYLKNLQSAAPGKDLTTLVAKDLPLVRAAHPLPTQVDDLNTLYLIHLV